MTTDPITHIYLSVASVAKLKQIMPNFVSQKYGPFPTHTKSHSCTEVQICFVACYC